MATKKKTTTKKTKKDTEEALGPCAQVHVVADAMPKEALPTDVYTACEEAGIHPSTARVQYAKWHKKKFGVTPTEKYGRAGKGTSPTKRTQRQGGVVPTPVMNDSEVPVITATPYAKQGEDGEWGDGWRSKPVNIGGVPHDVIVSPEGDEYIQAKANERADLIVDHTEKDAVIGRVRWKLLEHSGRGRKVRKEKKAAAKRAEAKEATKKKGTKTTTKKTTKKKEAKKKTTAKK